RVGDVRGGGRVALQQGRCDLAGGGGGDGRWWGSLDPSFFLGPCDLSLLFESLLDPADPCRDVEQHHDHGNPGEDVFLPLGQAAEYAMPSLWLREERSAGH